MDLMHAALDGLLSLLSPSGQRARLWIAIYHRVLPRPDPMRPGEVDASEFNWQMKLLADHFNILPLSEACQRLKLGTLPSRAACITFDDGYADNLNVAVPILKSYGLPATVFVATGFLGGGRMWNDTIIEFVRNFPATEWDFSGVGLGVRSLLGMGERYQTAMDLIYGLRYLQFDERCRKVEALVSQAQCALPHDLMLTTEGLRTLVASGIEVGAHTVNHPILSRLDDERVRQEIRQSQQVLEDITERPVTLFAFPNGKPAQDYDERHVAMVREAGFHAAVSTQWGVAKKGGDLFQLPRFSPWHRTPHRFHQALVRSYFW